jgi:uncharacterized LabA/DUF88 family protein
VKRRFALLVDGGFICKRIRASLERPPTHLEVLAECRKFTEHRAVADLDLLRIYYYDAPPATRQLTNPISGKSINLGRTVQHRDATAFQDALELSPDVALRKGDLAVRGWTVKRDALKDIGRTKRALAADDLRPNIQQKGVDLRIGLDIARLSLQRLVDTLVIVTGDSDMVPAFKFARREGVRVCLAFMGAPVMRELKAHADVIL